MAFSDPTSPSAPLEAGYARLFNPRPVSKHRTAAVDPWDERWKLAEQDFIADPAGEYRELVEAVAGGKAPVEALPEFTRCDGKTPGDLLNTTVCGAYLISSRLEQVLRDHAPRGWDAYPVELQRGPGPAIQGYRLLSVTGRCGPTFNARADKVWRTCPITPGYAYNAVDDTYFDPATWDGSDLFRPPGSGLLICTERVKLACEAARLRGIEFAEFATIGREGMLPDDILPWTTWTAASFRCVR